MKLSRGFSVVKDPINRGCASNLWAEVATSLFWVHNLNVVDHSDMEPLGTIIRISRLPPQAAVPETGGPRRFPPRHHLGELSQMRQEQLRMCPEGSSRARTPVLVECQRGRQDPGAKSAAGTGIGKSGEGGGAIP